MKNPLNDDHYDGNDEQIEDLKNMVTDLMADNERLARVLSPDVGNQNDAQTNPVGGVSQAISSLSEPSVGVIGFYRQDPGGKKSPNVVLALGDDRLTVFEVPTRMVFEIDREDWMSLSEMGQRILEVSNGERYNGGPFSDMKDAIMKGYVSSMVHAVRIAPEIPGLLYLHLTSESVPAPGI